MWIQRVYLQQHLFKTKACSPGNFLSVVPKYPEITTFWRKYPEIFVHFRSLFIRPPMVIALPIPSMKGQSRLRIKTHAAFGVGIGVRYGVILSKKPQFPYFPVRAQSERFAGFSGEGNRQSEPDLGIILSLGSIVINIWCDYLYIRWNPYLFLLNH